ncbi:hypothetical protein IKT64_02175 [Candidatus Saccharibacteria bacterium]|nr:hypothetical protein [Candidatus Saccharibacteria bacterium]
MSKKLTFSPADLNKLSSEQIIDKLQHRNYSLLKSLGGEKLRKEMVPVGKVCHLAINHFYHVGHKNNPKKRLEKAKARIVKNLHKITPVIYDKSTFPDTKNGLVLGFNHPSLGEIGRILLIKFELWGDKPVLFPVNLPWYEALAGDYDRLKALGIIITPTITPSTWKKLGIKEDSEIYEAASRIKRDFREIYTDLSINIVKDGGMIFVAPSATRQRTVFKTPAVYKKEEDVIPTMSILAIKLLTDEKAACDFLPVAVLPPKNFKRGLNLFKKYQLLAGDLMTADEIRKKYFKTKHPERLENFDYDFHQKIAEKLPKEFWY